MESEETKELTRREASTAFHVPFMRGNGHISPSQYDGDIIPDLLRPLDEVVESSPLLHRELAGRFQTGGRMFEIPRYRFTSATGADYRIGIFALIHGDEPAGGAAVVSLASWLVANAERLEGYEVLLYPICNPTGFMAGTRSSFSGKDLNREFWQGSLEPEIRILEAEIKSVRFEGLISLHSDDTSAGVYGFVRGAMLAEALLEPALSASEEILARDFSPKIDGFSAYHGIIYDGYPGILSSRQVKPQPFEIIYETPGLEAGEKQVAASEVALQTILLRYREFISYASNI
ncbi:MAG: succinylglutamate desuccinylase/aspartoacylase family protein [Chthoniobacterales bacterium]